MNPRENLFAQLPPQLPDELFQVLAEGSGARVERIVSRGHASPNGFWYDQPQAEFVLLIRGAARLQFEANGEEVALGPGDYLLIQPHQRHRVQWTTPAELTIWLAVHFDL